MTSMRDSVFFAAVLRKIRLLIYCIIYLRHVNLTATKSIKRNKQQHRAVSLRQHDLLILQNFNR